MDTKKVALAEVEMIRKMLTQISQEEASKVVDEIQKANRVFVGGAGRSLLSMKTFAMRLMQVKHETYLVGEVCTPSVQPGDLIIVASGKGRTQVTLDMVNKAKSHGARAVVLTQTPGAPIPEVADCVLVIPKTPAVEEEDSEELAFAKANLPGNFPETSIILILDGIIAELMNREGKDGSVINFMHANLE